MADDDGEEEREPVVELGEGEDVEGAPLARVSSRLTWGIEKSRLETREGNTEIRTPEGPKRLGDVLGSVEKSYFTRRQDFEDTIESVVGTGPIPTAEDDGDDTRESTDGTDTGTTPEESSDSNGDRSADSAESDGEDEDGSDIDLRSGTDADQGTDTESRAKTQGEAHAETSSTTDSESASEEERTDASGDDAGSEE
jgi:hypothetical protein